MIEYIYFVKCPNCEDEHFSFFNDAKEHALGCLSQKPIITQVEVNRNDFGECTDSCDLGTVWSWEDMMKDTEEDPTISVFTKDDLATYDDYDPDSDPEFIELDNSLDDIPDNFRRPIIKASMEENSSEAFEGRKSVPVGMTVESLVEEMEENEDTVECKWCNELFDKSECRYEVDLGYLCPRCEAAIKSRGETLTFVESVLNERIRPDQEKIYLEYSDLVYTLYGDQRDADDWDEEEIKGAFSYPVTKEDIATTIWEEFLSEEDIVDVPGGFEALEDDAAWAAFLETHFDALVNKYYNNLLEFYREDAEEYASENDSLSNRDYERRMSAGCDAYHAWKDEQLLGEHLSDWAEAGLEELDDLDEPEETAEEANFVYEDLETTEVYEQQLSLCPECGERSFDPETGICISCGFN